MDIVRRTFDKSIEVETELFDSLPTVEADGGQMQQVLLNLCLNARDAMPDGGRLIIEINGAHLTEDYARSHLGAKTGPYVVLSVADTGIGMTKEIVERAFEPFFTTKEKGKGTGLGLAMVYGVVKNHGGYVSVYSEPGYGTTFKVYLPANGTSATREDSLEYDASRSEGEMILVVDDEESVRSLAKDILESYGYTVLLAEDGAEAIETFRKYDGKIELVILDMIMPRMGGRDVLSGLKEINLRVKALLSTGYSQNGKAKEILDSGAMGFLQKPYHFNSLLSKVRSVLDAKTQPSAR